MVVVLARRSVPERVPLIGDSRAAGDTHSTGCRAWSGVLCGRDRRPPCVLLLLRPERHEFDTCQPRTVSQIAETGSIPGRR
jgi:hypothetical protein